MFAVTPRAKEELLRKKRSANIQDAHVGLRLTTTAGGRVVLVADKPKAGDVIVTHDDATVLLVDPEVSAFVVAGRTIDCRRTRDGRTELVLRMARAS